MPQARFPPSTMRALIVKVIVKQCHDVLDKFIPVLHSLNSWVSHWFWWCLGYDVNLEQRASSFYTWLQYSDWCTGIMRICVLLTDHVFCVFLQYNVYFNSVLVKLVLQYTAYSAYLAYIRPIFKWVKLNSPVLRIKTPDVHVDLLWQECLNKVYTASI